MKHPDLTRIDWQPELIQRYDLAGPRYTSYPTAPQFHTGFTEQDYRQALSESNASGAPLSLYFHIPFCAKICFYCGCNKIATKDTRKCEPYLAHLIQEMDLLATHIDTQRSVEQLHWGGGTPTFLSDEQMRRLMEATRQRFKLRDDDQGDYSIELDPREVSESTLPLLRELGFNRVSIGVQDLDPEVQQAINRIQPREMSQRVLDESRALGFRSINFDLIYGLPHQDLARFSDTLEQVIEMGPDRLSVFNYAHLPSRFKPQRRINEADLPSADEKLKILEHSIGRLVEAGYVYIGMDHFAKPDDSLSQAQREGRLHRNFQGYTTHSECDLLAIGASSIGQVGPTYVQNHHDAEAYQAKIGDQQFATIRGLKLTQDDVIRRAAINQLICHFELDGDAFGQQHQIAFNDYFADELIRLQQHERDGLLERQGQRLVVTPAGRLLIRSICMVFDAYLDQDQQMQKFSRII